MTVNPYFRRNKKGEQSLLQSLTTEAIKIHGHEMIYIPREKVTEDLILGEEVSQFKDANRIEMYLEGGEFEGDQEMSRFGLDVRESATFIVSRQRFLDVMGHNDDIRKKGRPREGDIIYFDYPFSMMEIKFVEHDNPFYPGGDRYSFKLVCEAFKYSNEKIDTGESEMDSVMEITSSYLIGMTLGSGSGSYKHGEEVYTGLSTEKKAFGRVVDFTDPVVGSSFVFVNRQDGTFEVGDILTGAFSGVTYAIAGLYDTTVRAGHQDQQDNEQLDLESNTNSIFDFSDVDPFSEGNYGGNG
jgi:hypothetical protein